MSSYLDEQIKQSRRHFLGRAACGIGSAALASLLNPRLLSADPLSGSLTGSLSGAASGAPANAAANPLAGSLGAINPLHFAPRAKRIIYLYMAGGPSHLETFDHKPKLAEMDGQPMPESFTKGQPIAQLQASVLKIKGPSFPFQKFGASGQEISAAFPNIGGVADDICIIRSMVTEQINHDPAHRFMNAGSSISGRPCMGSWTLYGLGSEAQNLPGFVVMVSVGGGQAQPIASRQWHSGFLPSKFQGVQFNSKGEPVYYLNPPPGVDMAGQREVLDAVNALNAKRAETIDDPEIAARIAQYELAFKMQASVPELADISSEPKSVLDMYGVEKLDGSFAANCLMARRMAERGVRFIQLYHRGWDHHGGVKRGIEEVSKLVDKASAALVADLKQRGMLEDTLVMWGGEFGRTPMAQGDGRDHHIKGFSMWMAGGGVKPGITYGATDELGYNAQENPVHVHDLHATVLRLLGVDHTKLTWRFQGRDFRLTDVFGNVVQDILA